MGDLGSLMFDARAERRDTARLPLMAAGTLRVEDRPVDAIVRDLSTHGCRVETPAMLRPGAHVTIGIGGIGVHPMIVTRADGHGYGCRFEEPLSPSELQDAAGGGIVHPAAFLPASPRPAGAAALPRLAYLAIGAAVVTLPAVAGWALVARLFMG